MDLYPDNKAQYLSFAGATNVTKYMRLMGSVSPGWLSYSWAGDQKF